MHFRSRLKQRYGLTLTTKEIKGIIDDIISGRGTLSKFHVGGKCVYRVVCRNEFIDVVYDRQTKLLVTALPLSVNINHYFIGVGTNQTSKYRKARDKQAYC